MEEWHEGWDRDLVGRRCFAKEIESAGQAEPSEAKTGCVYLAACCSRMQPTIVQIANFIRPNAKQLDSREDSLPQDWTVNT